MSNLDYVSPTLKKHIKDVLADPTVHNFAKDTIKQGLDKDCLDAYIDTLEANKVLKLVCVDLGVWIATDK